MRKDFRQHPVWYAFCVYCTIFGLLSVFCPTSGCGSGATQPPPATHTDYHGSLLPGVRWRQDVVLYRVVGGPPNPLGSKVRRTVIEGFNEWQEASAGYVVYREAQGPEKHDVTVKFVKVGSLGGSFLGNKTLARTTMQRDGNTLSSGVIEFDSELWGRLPTLKRQAAHEWGHGLGMFGHSPHPSDLMYSSPTRNDPSTADTNTLHILYTDLPTN